MLMDWKNKPIVKMSILTKAIYRFVGYLSKFQWHFFTKKTEQTILKCIRNYKCSKIPWTILIKENQSWRNHALWLQTVLQSYSSHNSMVLAQNQTYRSMEQNRESRNQPMHLWSTNLWQRRQEYTMEKRQCLQ